MEYLHGFSKIEQKRLQHQAKFLESFVYQDLQLPARGTLLEVGCGVGAQTQIILKRRPQLKVMGVDLSEDQLEVAHAILKTPIKKGRVELLQQNAMRLQLPRSDYNGAFLCWFLEHVPDPVAALKSVRAHLKKGAPIFCTEVFNQSLFLEPYAPGFLKYWFEFNDLQWSIHGHPFVGVELGNLLHRAGFKKIDVRVVPMHFDDRTPKQRAAFAEYFLNILLSAEDRLVGEGRVTPELVNQVKEEFGRLRTEKGSVFFYSFLQATAVA